MGLAILTYHSLDRSGSVVSTRPELFREQIESLVERAIPLASLDKLLDTPRSVALTFDDGYENFAEAALPLLAQYRIPATVFVVSAHCGQFNAWDRPGRFPRCRLMSWETLRTLPPDLISIGAHSVSHPDLTQLSIEQMQTELRDSRIEIEQRTGRAVEHFAYPYGRQNQNVRQAAAREYSLAVGTRLEPLPANPDRLNLPRIDVYYLRRLGHFRRQTEDGGGSYLAVRRWLREWRHPQ